MKYTQKEYKAQNKHPFGLTEALALCQELYLSSGILIFLIIVNNDPMIKKYKAYGYYMVRTSLSFLGNGVC